MSKSNACEANYLNLLFCAKAWANVADNASSSPITDLWCALHTADPGDAGTQATSEASYTGYTRIATSRSTGSAGWTVSTGGANGASPNTAITFPQNTGTSTGTITYFSVGKTSSGAGDIFYSGTVSPNINFSQNVTPILTTGSSITED